MKKLLLLLLFLNALTSLALAKNYSLTTNSLKNNHNWQSSKLALGKVVMGSWNFFNQTQTLNGNMLNLGAWHGFQEIQTSQKYVFDKLQLDAKFSEDSYLLIYYQINPQEKNAVIISTKESESACLRLDDKGKFIERHQINLNIRQLNEWQKIQIETKTKQANIHYMDQVFSCQSLYPGQEPTSIGFKNGLNDVIVDNVLLEHDAKAVFFDSFSNDIPATFILFTIFIPITIVQVMSILLFRKIAKKPHKLISVFILLNIAIFLSLLISYFYLTNFFVGNYPNINSILSSLKKEEEIWIDREVEMIGNQIMNQYRDVNLPKVLFIGSSQTWGAGASKDDNTFASLFEKRINQVALMQSIDATKSADATNSASATQSAVLGAATENIEVINTGISGATSKDLLNQYKKSWLLLEPTLVFINLASNDFDYGTNPYSFKKDLEEFILINKEKEIETVLLVEARSKEHKVKNEFHKIVFEIANKHNLLVIDINKYLIDKNNTGLIWWDFVHPTDYGHELISEYIFKEISEKKPILLQKMSQIGPQISSQSGQTN